MDLATLLSCWGSSGCLITQTTSGLISGSVLFIVASGLTLIFGVLGFVNFMHGSLYMIGSYLAYSAFGLSGSFLISVAAAGLGTALLSAALERTIVRRIYDINPLFQILVCYALILIFDDAVRLIWGNDFLSMGMPDAFRTAPLMVLGGVIPPFYLVLITVAVAIALALSIALHRTRIGQVIRAAAHNRAMVASLGINTGAIFTIVFALGGALAGAAGGLAAPVRSISSGMGFSILIDSFIVVVIGGMGSVTGALLVALGLGVFRAFGSLGFPLFTDGLVFLTMTLFLMFRPTGLFGTKVRHA